MSGKHILVFLAATAAALAACAARTSSNTDYSRRTETSYERSSSSGDAVGPPPTAQRTRSGEWRRRGSFARLPADLAQTGGLLHPTP